MYRRPALDALGAALSALSAGLRVEERLAVDPVAFPRRYPDPGDAEVSALFSAVLAFGRVASIGATLRSLHGAMDRAGGPRAWLQVSGDGTVESLVHRWVRGPDLLALARGLARLLDRYGTLGDAFGAHYHDEPHVESALSAFVAELRAGAEGPRTRGLDHLWPSPAQGSACKRWNLLLRWMVRPDDGVDLGLWPRIPTRALVIPLDTHVLRIARLLGLTRRTDGSWRTAVEVTRSLARFDPQDPVRFDFALAHLGIGGTCRRDGTGCGACPLMAACADVASRERAPTSPSR